MVFALDSNSIEATQNHPRHDERRWSCLRTLGQSIRRSPGHHFHHGVPQRRSARESGRSARAAHPRRSRPFTDAGHLSGRRPSLCFPNHLPHHPHHLTYAPSIFPRPPLSPFLGGNCDSCRSIFLNSCNGLYGTIPDNITQSTHKRSPYIISFHRRNTDSVYLIVGRSRRGQQRLKENRFRCKVSKLRFSISYSKLRKLLCHLYNRLSVI